MFDKTNKNLIIILLLALCSLSTLLAQNDLQKQAAEQQGFLLDMPQITNPHFEWGLQLVGDKKSWWSNQGYGINFNQYELVFSNGQSVENFLVSEEDESIFTTEKGKEIVKVQIGLVGFGNSKEGKSKKLANMELEFRKQPSNISQKQQPLTNLLVDAIKNNAEIEEIDTNNIYVICDQMSDEKDVLGYEQARCIIWYRSVVQLIPRRMMEQKNEPNLPNNYHYYYIQVDADDNAFNERQALVADLYEAFDSLKASRKTLYHLYVADGTKMITVAPDEPYDKVLDNLLDFSPDPPSLEAHRDRIWRDIGKQYNLSYMQKLSAQQKDTGDFRYGNVYFHYYLSDEITKATDINGLICSMLNIDDKALKNTKIYIHQKKDGIYQSCLLDHNTCNELDYKCE